MRTTGQLSKLAAVSVRALHHYDEIGLLSPSVRSNAGYRLYTYADLVRLHEILAWRALGFPLAEIQEMLDDPGYDRARALARQHALVESELERLGSLRRALEAALTAERDGTRLEEEIMFEGFDPAAYEAEVRERWGDTEAHRESARRTSGYGECEWRQIRAESERIVRDFASLLRAGEPATGDAAQELAGRHRKHISRWFYPCSDRMHRALGSLYVGDARFARNFEREAAGLAAYVRTAIDAAANRQ